MKIHQESSRYMIHIYNIQIHLSLSIYIYTFQYHNIIYSIPIPSLSTGGQTGPGDLGHAELPRLHRHGRHRRGALRRAEERPGHRLRCLGRLRLRRQRAGRVDHARCGDGEGRMGQGCGGELHPWKTWKFIATGRLYNDQLVRLYDYMKLYG